MTRTFNQYSLNLILTVFFIIGIGISFYFIYSLPVHLNLSERFQPEFLKVYITVALTALFGIMALLRALGYKKEVLVFRDRIIDTSRARMEAEKDGKKTISLDGMKAAITESKDEKELLENGIHTICTQLHAGQGAIYRVAENKDESAPEKRRAELRAGYALSISETRTVSYAVGEGLIGQVAATGNTLFIDEVPQGYITILSGLGSSSPRYLMIVPVKRDQNVLGVLEVASFSKPTEDERKFMEECGKLMAEKLSA